MRKSIMALALSCVAVVAGPAHFVSANPPLRPPDFSGKVDFTFFAPVTSATCGFDIFEHVTATISVTFFTDQNGTIVRAYEIWSDARNTWFAPSLGTSYSYPVNGATRVDFPQGVSIGAPVIVDWAFLLQKIPGERAEAGRIVWEGEVAFITPEGIPLYETNPEPSIVTGSFGHFSYADRCKALTP